MCDFTDNIVINHFIITCEFKEDIVSYMVYMEWLDGSNFQYLGSVNTIQEWEILKSAIKLLCISKGIVPVDLSSLLPKILDNKNDNNK